MSAALLPEWRDDRALFLDVDGTLLEIAQIPAAVRVPQRAIRLLASLHPQLDGAIALVTGRRIADLDALFAPLRLPAAGVHGAERRDAAGHVTASDRGARLAPARRVLAAWQAAHTGTVHRGQGRGIGAALWAAPKWEVEARRAVIDALAAVVPTSTSRRARKCSSSRPIRRAKAARSTRSWTSRRFAARRIHRRRPDGRRRLRRGQSPRRTFDRRRARQADAGALALARRAGR